MKGDNTILRKAIERAIKRGYVPNKGYWKYSKKYLRVFTSGTNKHFRIIFSHLFAKSFWGEFKMRYYDRSYKDISKEDYNRINDDSLVGKEIVNEGWQHHLQRMVLEEEPLKYLEKFL